MKNTILYFTGCLLVLQSCTIQKRHYLPGFDIQWKKPVPEMAATPVKDDSSFAAEQTEEQTEKQTEEKIEALPGNLVATIHNDVLYPEEPVRLKPVADDSCATIVKMNGDEIRAMVLRITESAIEYKRCDIPDGPLYEIRRSSVFMIKFSNGTKEVIAGRGSEANGDDVHGRIIHPLSMLSILCLFVSIFALFEIPAMLLFTLPMGLVFALIGLLQSQKRPEDFLPVSKVLSIITLVIAGLFAALLLGTIL